VIRGELSAFSSEQSVFSDFWKSVFGDQSAAIGFILSGLRFHFPLFL
jgi:hypothetical protein